MSGGDLDHLARVLTEAEEAREADVAALADMSEDELAYLAGVGEQPDPLSDGLEAN